MSHINMLLKFLLVISLGLSLISNTNGFTLKMIPIDSPHLNVRLNRFSAKERHQFLINISMSRVQNHRKELEAALSPNSIRMTTSRSTHSYFVTQLSLGEGAGASTPYVQIDTTADVTWLQCQDCNPCFMAPNFQYKLSTSFKQVGVHDPMCFPPVFNYQGACGLSLEFDLGTGNIVGIYGQDNFQFKNTTTQKPDVYYGLVFGCGLKNENIHFPVGNIIGVFGLGTSPISLTTQLQNVIKGRFSYCLPSLKPTNPTNLDFGDDAGISGDAMTQVKTIAMHVGKQYFLYLTGVSVAGQRVSIDTKYLDPGTDFKNGFFIDTGSPYTVLAEGIHNPIKDAVAKYFKDKYNWEPTGRQQSWELCHSLSYFHEWETPNIILHFWNIDHTEEVDMILDKNQLFQDLSEEYDLQGLFCLMMMVTPDPGPSFLGAFQQVNYKFLYDLNNKALSFVLQTC